MNPLYVGIDVGSRNNAVYLMKPNGDKYSCFEVQNTQGGAKQRGGVQWDDTCGGVPGREGAAAAVYAEVRELRKEGVQGR